MCGSRRAIRGSPDDPNDAAGSCQTSSAVFVRDGRCSRPAWSSRSRDINRVSTRRVASRSTCQARSRPTLDYRRLFAEQLELPNLSAVPCTTLGSCRIVIPPVPVASLTCWLETGDSMTTRCRHRLSQRRAILAAPLMPQTRQPGRRQSAWPGMSPRQTSRPVAPASVHSLRRPGNSVKRAHLPSRPLHAPARRSRPRGASNKEPHALPRSRSCGRYRAELYNTIHPHKALGYRSPRWRLSGAARNAGRRARKGALSQRRRRAKL